MAEMIIRFPGNMQVSAVFDGFQVLTDQPAEAGGGGAAPAPFDLFLASLGTCAGYFALSFCQKRKISTEGLELRQAVEWDDARRLASKVSLTITLPRGFPEKYRDGLVRAVELCTVKRHLAEPPAFVIDAKAGAVA